MARSAESKKLSKEPSVPRSLKSTLSWFASVITTPLNEDSKLQQEKKEQASQYITDGPTLSAGERIELYYQQYWWRLLDNLQTNFPSLIRLVGCKEFNTKIGVPYLSAYPPSHWGLSKLGETLPKWIYDANPLPHIPYLSELATLDREANATFYSPSLPPLEVNNSLNMEDIAIQPFINLVKLKNNSIEFRERLLEKPPHYWQENPLPPLAEGMCFLVIYRDPEQRVCWRKVSETEYSILLTLRKLTILEALAIMEETASQQELENIPFWFRDWTALNWLGVTR